MKSSPRLPQLEKAHAQQRRHSVAKKKTNKQTSSNLKKEKYKFPFFLLKLKSIA